MKTFPMFLNLAERRVVICGGGAEAARKLRLMQKTEARITVVADRPDPEIAAAALAGALTLVAGEDAVTFAGAALVFVATGDDARDAAFAARARAAGAVVNVVDRPALCTAFTPSLVDRDPVVVAIGTEGTAPVLGRMIRTEIETLLDPRLGGFAALAGRLRAAVEAAVPHRLRRGFWERALAGPAFQRFRRGDAAGAEAAMMAEAAHPVPRGHVALVGAGPGARDLLTLRAVRRLQEADVILHDRLVDPEAMELARRDADRVCVGKAVGANEWPQARIDALIVAEALAGRRVVRLKSGDPSIFGRATEELAAARAAGIEVEIVPGVTAASAAAAALGRSLTERGEIDTLVVTTATCRPGDPAPDLAALARPGTATALYMGVERVGEVQARLLSAGVPAEAACEVVAAASTGREQVLRTTLADLAQEVRREGIASPAVMIVRHPKQATALAVAAE